RRSTSSLRSCRHLCRRTWLTARPQIGASRWETQAVQTLTCERGGLFGEGADLCHVGAFRHDPASPDAEHRRVRQPLRRGFGADPARWTKPALGERRCERLQCLEAAGRFSREELEVSKAEVEPVHDLAGRGHTRKERNTQPAGSTRDIVAQSRGHDELCSRCVRLFKLRLVDDRPRTYDRARYQVHPPDRVEGGWSTQSHLKHAQSARHQGFGYGPGVM